MSTRLQLSSGVCSLGGAGWHGTTEGRSWVSERLRGGAWPLPSRKSSRTFWAANVPFASRAASLSALHPSASLLPQTCPAKPARLLVPPLARPPLLPSNNPAARTLSESRSLPSAPYTRREHRQLTVRSHLCRHRAAPPPAYAQQAHPPAHAPAAPSAGGGMFANVSIRSRFRR